MVLLAIHSDKDENAMRAAVSELQMPWLVAQDARQKRETSAGAKAAEDGGLGLTMKAFRADSFPDYYLIDRSGKLRFADLANSEVERAVELLIKEKP